MPCMDGGDDRDNCSGGLSAAELSASLCSAFWKLDSLGKLQEFLRDKTSQNERGVSRRALEDWWTEHRALDVQRKADEAASRKRDKLAKRAKSKLTQEELDALRDTGI